MNTLINVEPWVIDNIRKTYRSQKEALQNKIFKLKHTMPGSTFETENNERNLKILEKDLSDLQLSYIEIINNSGHE